MERFPACADLQTHAGTGTPGLGYSQSCPRVAGVHVQTQPKKTKIMFGEPELSLHRRLSNSGTSNPLPL